MISVKRVATLALLLTAGCTPQKAAVWPDDCSPHTVPIAGWRAPYSVTIGDTVLGWHLTEKSAMVEAVSVARETAQPVRIASIVEVRFLKNDEPCVPFIPEPTQTAMGGAP